MALTTHLAPAKRGTSSGRIPPSAFDSPPRAWSGFARYGFLGFLFWADLLLLLALYVELLPAVLRRFHVPPRLETA